MTFSKLSSAWKITRLLKSFEFNKTKLNFSSCWLLFLVNFGFTYFIQKVNQFFYFHCNWIFTILLFCHNCVVWCSRYKGIVLIINGYTSCLYMVHQCTRLKTRVVILQVCKIIWKSTNVSIYSLRISGADPGGSAPGARPP